MKHRDVLAIGTSAGGHGALGTLAAALPSDFPAAILVVMHLAPTRPSALADFLNNSGPLPAAFARDGDLVRPGRFYVAPPDHHLLVEGTSLILRRGPTENNARPAIDPLFRSVAVNFRGRSIGLLLTGMLSDGVAGLEAIKRCGGITVVQKPADAEYPEMPQNALAQVDVDHVATLDGLGPLLRRLVALPVGPCTEPPKDIRLETAIAAQDNQDPDTPNLLGVPTILTCPDCHGVLWEMKNGELVRYRCHIGHAYTIDALGEARQGELDRALSSGLRALQERVQLMRRLADHSRRFGHANLAKHWDEREREYAHQANLVRRVLLGSPVEEEVK